LGRIEDLWGLAGEALSAGEVSQEEINDAWFSAQEAKGVFEGTVGSYVLTWGGGGAAAAPRGAIPAVPTRALPQVPGRVLSRINISKAGWEHLLKRHFPGGSGSQFSVTQGELRTLLESKNLVRSPVIRTLESPGMTRYVREINTGRAIGVDKLAGGAPTSILTVISDKFGNLLTAFPGILP
jgi:filamentous hemagglutinin